MRGKRITEEQRKQIRYLSFILHYSQRSIALELGIGKSTVQRVLKESDPQSVQHRVKPKVQISNDQLQEKAKVWSPAKLKVASPKPTSPWPEFDQGEGEVDATIRTEDDRADEFGSFLDSLTRPRQVEPKSRPRQIWGDIVGRETYRILEKHGLPRKDIRSYCDVFAMGRTVIFNDRALLTSLTVAFGERAGPAAQAAYFDFKAIQPKLMRMYLSQEA